jgi:hypothetical protein
MFRISYGLRVNCITDIIMADSKTSSVKSGTKRTTRSSKAVTAMQVESSPRSVPTKRKASESIASQHEPNAATRTTNDDVPKAKGKRSSGFKLPEYSVYLQHYARAAAAKLAYENANDINVPQALPKKHSGN